MKITDVEAIVVSEPLDRIAKESWDGSQDAVVIRVTLDFWNAYLRHKHAAVPKLVHDATVPNLATISYDTGH